MSLLSHMHLRGQNQDLQLRHTGQIQGNETVFCIRILNILFPCFFTSMNAQHKVLSDINAVDAWPVLTSVRCCVGSQDAVNRSEWYSYNPMSSVTTVGTSGSDAASTLGGLDQSSADCVLMASPIRGQHLLVLILLLLLLLLLSCCCHVAVMLLLLLLLLWLWLWLLCCCCGL